MGGKIVEVKDQSGRLTRNVRIDVTHRSLLQGPGGSHFAYFLIGYCEAVLDEILLNDPAAVGIRFKASTALSQLVDQPT